LLRRLRQSSRPPAPAITATARAIHQAPREPPEPVVPAVCSATEVLARVAAAAVDEAAVLGRLLGVLPLVTSAWLAAGLSVMVGAGFSGSGWPSSGRSIQRDTLPSL
jgi:hypothetical protein